MMEDATDGLISRIVVKKYDRFGRNLRKFLNITDQLKQCNVGVTSLSEDFNTTTPAGEAMLANLVNFSEFERKTIAARVADAYNTRAEETGFYQGGKVYYGYVPERRTVNGKTGSVLVPSDKADVVRTAYSLYKNPDISLSSVLSYFIQNGIEVNINPQKNMDRSHLSQILKSPLYVRADKEVYQYFISKGYRIVDDVAAFDGVHGCFRHKQADGIIYIKIGYHEGLVDAETWLMVQDKKSRNSKYRNNGNARNSWLTGLAKCGHCHYALSLVYSWNASRTKQWRYYDCSGAYKANGCIQKRLQTRPDDVEALVLEAMKKRLEELTIAKTEKRKPDTAAESIKAEIIRIDGEIRNLMGILGKVNERLFPYTQDQISELIDRKAELELEYQSKVRKRKEIDTAPLTDPMSRWDTLSTEEKHTLAATIINVVYVSDENGISIDFSI